MRDRKILYILLLTIVVGSAVTLCTSFLTGGLNRAGQVTVTLAGGEEKDGAEGSAVGLTSGGDASEAEVSGMELAQKPQAYEETTEASPVAKTRLQENESDVKETAKADEEAADAGEAAPASVDDNAVQILADAYDTADAEAPEEAAAYDIAVSDASGMSQKSEEIIYEKANAQQVALSPLETAAATDSAGQTFVVVSAESLDGGALLDEESPYLKRLKELDAQIQKSRETQNVSNTASNTLAKNAASNELKLWDSELNTIYNEILKTLNEKQTQELVAAERQWMKSRDAAAVEAAKNSAGGSLESVEYTASLAETTRTRAYELVNQYASVLAE